AKLVAEFPKMPVEIAMDGSHTTFRPQWLNDNGSRSAPEAVEPEGSPQSIQIVREPFLDVGGRRPWYADGFSASGAGNAHAVDHLVAPAVIGAPDFDHPLSTCIGAGEPKRGHHGFRSRPEHAEHLDGGHSLADQFGQFDFVLMQQAGDGTAGVEQRMDL